MRWKKIGICKATPVAAHFRWLFHCSCSLMRNWHKIDWSNGDQRFHTVMKYDMNWTEVYLSLRFWRWMSHLNIYCLWFWPVLTDSLTVTVLFFVFVPYCLVLVVTCGAWQGWLGNWELWCVLVEGVFSRSREAESRGIYSTLSNSCFNLSELSVLARGRR
jgi:hypothetical protein